MEKDVITRQAVERVLLLYWRQYKNDRLLSIIGFSLPALGTVLVFFVPPLIVAHIINIFAAQGTIAIASVSNLLIAFALLWFTGELFWRIGMHALIELEARGASDLARTGFSWLTERDYDFFSNNFVGSLTKKGLAFTKNFEQFTDTLSFNLISSTITVSFAVYILWGYSPIIPLILLSAIGIALVLGIPIIKRRSQLVALRHDASSRVSGRLSDSITNMLAVKSFAKENAEQTTFSIFMDDYMQKFRRAANYQNQRFDMVMSPLYVITNLVGLTAAIYFAGTLQLTPGAVVVVFSYFSQVTRIFWDMNRIYRHLESSISEAAEFTQLFIRPPHIQDAPNAVTLSVTQATISFEHVDFGYTAHTTDNEPFLKDFNLVIQPKEKVGLVGPSGGGKTTITKLLLRFIEAQSGSILIDGQDITRATQSSLRNAIAYVPQEPLLFHRSLFENISYGNEHASKEEVVRAAKHAHADEFISCLPHGYDTLVGERGIKLSGGQRQRIAIARAILKQASILILDEATSSLDSESEKYIQEGLKKLTKNKTALVIAHRFSTIKHLDRIVVLSNGGIVQQGTHAELIKKSGLYARLWKHQSGDFLTDIASNTISK